MKVPILCYHSCNAGDSYATDDHVALAADLRTIYRLGFRVVPLDWVVEALLGEREPLQQSVALTCDDGVDLDWIDADHPTYGRRRSFANIIRDFVAESGERDPPVEMTSFVVASPTTRKELEVACLAGLDWWNDTWWRDAEASGVMKIESHSYDHVHPLAGRVAQRDQRKGDFRLVDTFDDCEAEVAAASACIGERSGRTPRYFAYPYGQASDYLRATYLPERGPQIGLRAAFSIDHAYVTEESDRWFLPRFTHGAEDTSSPADLERILRGACPSDASFRDRLHVQRFANAAYFAGELFRESFGSAFPVPPESSGWAQYVAFYRWDDGRIEPVGFCNYLPFDSVWLEGGLCVRRTFYSRLPSAQAEECRAQGGVAQIIMETAAREIGDCDAWFAYIGDERSLKVCTRVGYRPTDRQYIMAKWFRTLPEERQAAVIERVAALGPF